MRRLALSLLAFAPAAAFAQAVPDPGANEKINQIIVYGEQACPVGTADEIVICVRVQDQYRIPAPLRSDPNAPQNQAWGARAQALEYIGKTGIQSCSAAGAGGATGCFSKLVEQARAERRDGTNWVALVEDARQDRLGTIDARSDQIEADVKAREAAEAAKKAAEKKPE